MSEQDMSEITLPFCQIDDEGRMWRRPEESEWCEVRNSEIHGSGIFAAKDIPVGTPIMEYVGEVIGKEESDRRGLDRMEHANKTGDAAVYIFIINDDFDIDGSYEWNIARLINHSCSPNCESAIDEDDRIWLSAAEYIPKGAELSFDYGFDLENYLDHPCRCGTDNCIGYIVGRDYWKGLKKLEKKRLAKVVGKAKKKDKGKKKRKSGKK